MTDAGAGAPGAARPRNRGRRGLPAWARRSILGVVVGGLVAGNAWVIRKQFPPAERQKNAAYDAGLRALDLDRDYAKAEIEFRRYLAIDARSPRVRYLLALTLQCQGKNADAASEYAKVLEEEPDSDDARVALAEIAHAEQNFEEAFRHLDLALKDDPTPTAAYVLRAQIYAATGDQDGAVAAYREALRRNPDAFECAVELGDLLMARSVLGASSADRQAAAGVYREAEQICRRRLASAEDRRVRLLLAKAIAGQARVLQQRQLAEAVAELRKAAELDPDDPEPTVLLGSFFRAAGNLEEARRILEDARRKWKDPRVLLALHDLYREQDRRDDALQVLRDAVADRLDDPALRVRLVAYLVSLGRVEDAEREADAAQQLFPDEEQVHAARGDLCREVSARAERAGDADAGAAARAQALAAYRRALELRPRSIRLKKLVAGQLIDAILRKPQGAPATGDETFARACVEDVLRVNSRDAEALGWRARLLLADGAFADVVALLRPTLDTAAPPPDTLRLLGTAAARTGDLGLAATAFARVVDLQRDPERERREPGSGPPAGDWWNAVHAALEAGRHDAAVEMGRVAVERFPGAVELRRELAAAHLARGDADDALRLMRAARAEFPQDAPTRFLLARAYEAAGRPDAAEDELKSAAVDLPGEASRMAYFEFLARTGRAEAAEQGFLAMIASDPENPAAHLRLGDFYLALDPPRTDAALAQYESALARAPGSAQALLRIAELQLGRALRSPGAYEDAERAVEAFAAAAASDPWTDYARGKLALAGGRPSDAVPFLARFTAKVPTSSSGLYHHARALRETGDLDAAIPLLERAVELGRGDRGIALELATLRHDAGVKAFERGDFASAKRLFAAAEAGGAGRGSRLFLAGAQANAGELELSEKECRRVLEETPGHAAAMHLLAQILLRKGTKDVLDEVESLYRARIAADGSDLLAALGLGTVKFQRGDFRGALATLREFYPRTNGAPTVAMAIAQCMALLNDSAGAVEFLDGEIKAHPDSAGMHHLKGDFLVHVRQHQDAVKSFLRAFELDNDNHVAVLAAAAALLEARDPDGARRILVERLPRVKAPGLLHLAIGETLLAQNREDEAGESLRQALALVPEQPRALYLLGRIAERAGQKAEAKRLYRESSRRVSSDGDAFARLAQIAASEGEPRVAIENYRAALRVQPRNVVYLNNLAALLGEEEGGLDEALAAATNAYALEPERPEFADTCGWLLFRAGRVKEAAALLEPAATRLKTNAVLQYHAGMALARLSRTTDARDFLERALRIDPNFPGADAARAEIARLR